MSLARAPPTSLAPAATESNAEMSGAASAALSSSSSSPSRRLAGEAPRQRIPMPARLASGQRRCSRAAAARAASFLAGPSKDALISSGVAAADRPALPTLLEAPPLPMAPAAAAQAMAGAGKCAVPAVPMMRGAGGGVKLPTAFSGATLDGHTGGEMTGELCSPGEAVRLTAKGIPYLVDLQAREGAQLDAALLVAFLVIVLAVGVASAYGRRS
eukprot:TRINITY_DN5196_c0_g1_i4.p2 TRINITY_DN5196_c0_g1~~TRINITY_DN5196_c0_g1_i4.p2  ORF type:complete len:214 (+),score=56.95 TRINITY_DN5196_c0_g1_i4:66-707(+)